jgi:hypothetical protein
MIAGWLFLFSYSTRNLRFPVMLSLFPLGCLVYSWHVNNYFKNIADKVTCFLIFAKQVFFKRIILFISLILILIFVYSYWKGSNINQKILNQRINSSLEIGLTGIVKRIDWLENSYPQKLLSSDGRLMQLLSVKDSDFLFYSPMHTVDLSDYGYIVASDTHLPFLEKIGLNELFVKDLDEKSQHLYIRRDLINIIYGIN